MSFLERLRHQKEAESLQAQLEANRLLEKQKQERIAEEARRKAKEVEKQLQEERRRQALSFREEAGVPKLIEELCEIDRGLYTLPPEKMSHGGDSVFDGVYWRTMEFVKKEGRVTTYSNRYFRVESRHNGEITFHCKARRQPIVVPETQWRGKPQSLEDALEKAYHSPELYTTYTEEPKPSIGNA